MSTSREERARGPFVVWVDYGYEGWAPDSYETLEEASTHESYGNTKIITRRVKWKVVEDPMKPTEATKE